MNNLKYLLLLLLLFMIIIFLIQNVFVQNGNIYSYIEVKFLSFSVVTPIIGLLLLNFLIGFLTSFIWLGKIILNLRGLIKEKENIIIKLENDLKKLRDLSIEQRDS